MKFDQDLCLILLYELNPRVRCAFGNVFYYKVYTEYTIQARHILMYISNATFINVTFRAFLIKFETDVNEIYYMYLFIFDMQSVFLVCYHLFLRHVIDSHSKGTLRTDLL